MGVGPVSWQSLAAWQQATGVRIDPWELRLLRRLSVEYVAEGHRAEAENAPPPWPWQPTPDEREFGEAQLRAVLG